MLHLQQPPGQRSRTDCVCSSLLRLIGARHCLHFTGKWLRFLQIPCIGVLQDRQHITNPSFPLLCAPYLRQSYAGN